MILKILVTVTALLALAPNLLIGYLYLNKDKIIEQQKEALIKSIGGQLTNQLGKQTEALTGNMDSMFTDKVKPEICLLYTSPSPRDLSTSRMPSSA